MKRLLAICAALAAWLPGDAIAQSHLYPVDPNDDYQAVLDHAFAEARDSRAIAQAIIIPNYDPEQSVSLHRIGQRYTLRVLEPVEHLWRYALAGRYESGEVRLAWTSSAEQEAQELARERAEILDGLPSDPADVRLDRCESDLSAGTGRRLAAAWHATTGAARPDTPEEMEARQDDTIILHGTSFHFWSRAGVGEETSGRVYAPRNGRALALAQMAHSLAALCEGRISERRLVSQLDELEEALRQAA